MKGLLAALLICIPPAPDDAATLASRLSSDDIAERHRAAEALVKMGAAARAAVLPLRSSKNPETAFLARQTLGHIDWDPCLPPCYRTSPSISFEALGSPDPETFQAAFAPISGLVRTGLAHNRGLETSPDDARLRILFLHTGLADDGLLREWTCALDPEAFWNDAREFAKRLLLDVESRSWQGAAFPWLKPLLASPARSRRILAAVVLAQAKDPDALPVLAEAIGQPVDVLHSRVCLYLGRDKYFPALPRLVEAAARGDPQAFQAVTQIGWDGHLDVLRTLARAEDKAFVPWMAHRELAQRGDRSCLPGLLARVQERKGPSLQFSDTEMLDAALAYETDEAIRIVVQRLDAVEHWGRHGITDRVHFGPRGARYVWERFVKESRGADAAALADSMTAAYVVLFCRGKDLVEPAREAIHADVSARVHHQAALILSDAKNGASLDAKDIERLRGMAESETGPFLAVSSLLISRRDPEFIEAFRKRADRTPVLELFRLLKGIEGPEFRELFARHAAGRSPVEVRAFCAVELGRYRDRATAALLTGLLSDPAPSVQAAALQALWKFPDSLLRDHLPSLARGPGTLRLLARLDPERAREAASRLLKGAPDPEEAQVAREILPAPLLSPAEARALALDPQKRLEGYGHLGPESVDLLLEAAWTEAHECQRAVMEALGRIGGAKVRTFLQECAARSDQGKPVPPPWPIVAARMGAGESVPSLLRRIETSPDLLALRALDAIIHRDGYAGVPRVLPGAIVGEDLESAFRQVGEACRLSCTVSPAAAAAFRKQITPDFEASLRLSVYASFEHSVGGPILDFLLSYSPKVTTVFGSSHILSSDSREVEWAPFLEAGVLRILTPEEARQEWRAWAKSNPRK